MQTQHHHHQQQQQPKKVKNFIWTLTDLTGEVTDSCWQMASKGLGRPKVGQDVQTFQKWENHSNFLFFFCFCLFLSRLKLEGGDICVASSFENQTLLKVELNGLPAGAAAASSSSTSSSSPKKERDPIAEFFENISIRIAGETKYCKPSQTNHLLKAVLSDCMAQR